MTARLFSLLFVVAVIVAELTSACTLFPSVGDDSEGPCGLTGCAGPCASQSQCQPPLCGADGCSGPCASAPKCRSFTLSACSGARGVYEPLVGLTLNEPADFLQLVETDAVAGGDARILATKGTLCKGASDVAACQRASASLDLGGGWPATGGDATRKNAAALRHSLVFTRGDTVSIVKTIEDLRAMVAPVDSIEKAALLVTESLDRQIDCGKNHADKVDGGGYEFFMSRTTRFVNPGCQEHEEYVDRVDGAGTASMLKSEPVRLGGGC